MPVGVDNIDSVNHKHPVNHYDISYQSQVRRPTRYRRGPVLCLIYSSPASGGPTFVPTMALYLGDSTKPTSQRCLTLALQVNVGLVISIPVQVGQVRYTSLIGQVSHTCLTGQVLYTSLAGQVSYTSRTGQVHTQALQTKCHTLATEVR